MTDTPTMIDTQTAAERLGVERRHVYYLVQRGLLPSAVKYGHRTMRIDEADVMRLIKQGYQRAAS